MKLAISRSSLLAALGAIGKIADHRSSIPILSNFKLSAHDGLRVTATDMDLTGSAFAEATVSEPGETCVSASALRDFVTKAPGDITIETSSETLKIKSGKARASIPTLPASDFPAPADEHDSYTSSFTLPRDTFNAVLLTPSISASTEETRYYLQGVYLESRVEGIRGTATDGHRLVSQTVASDEDDNVRCIVPARTIAHLRGLPDGDVAIQVSGRLIAFSVNSTRFVSRLIDGTFPDYERVIPQDFKTEATFRREELRDAVDRVAAMSYEDKSRGIKLSLASDGATISCRGQIEAADSVDIQLSGPPVEIGFNSRYLLGLLDLCHGDEIAMRFVDSGAPALIVDSTNAGLVVVLMPMRV